MDDGSEDDDKNYPIGFGRPPKHTQFKKGQSGNPSGRPKGSKNLKTLLWEVMMEPTVVKKGHRKRKVPGLIALCKLQMAMAAGGDTKAFQAITALASRERIFDQIPPATKAKPEEPPHVVIERMLNQIGARLRGEAEGCRPSPEDEPIKP